MSSTIYSQFVILVGLMTLISHIIVLTRKIKTYTLMIVFVLLSISMPFRVQCNFNASAVYATKQKRLTPSKTSCIELSAGFAYFKNTDIIILFE